jgi:hypothetical protein
MPAPLHTIVGFVADFPVLKLAVDPAGKEMADCLHAELIKAGFAAAPPEDYEGWAWDICTRDGDAEVTTRVGLVDDMETSPPRQWLITNEGFTITPILKSLFGRESIEAVAKREGLLRRVCETLHGFMKSDVRFSHLNWYDAQTFDKPGDVPSGKPQP